MALRYLSDNEVVRCFGDPTEFINEDGSIGKAWEIKILSSFPLPAALPYCADHGVKITRVRCNKRILSFLQAALGEIYDDKNLWGAIGDFGGCYNWRTQRKSKNLSRHSWGIAIDIDVNDNPMNTKGIMPQKTIDIFKSYGFLWGGNFRTRKDPMHFEFGDPSLLGVIENE